MINGELFSVIRLIMDNSLLIKNVLYTKGLYDDVINIIIDYTKLTLPEQCLDPKSLKRCQTTEMATRI